MAMSRSLGSKSFTTRAPMRISPEVIGSSPATMRSSVDLPQPDGPTITTNSPSATSVVTPWMTSSSPYFLRTSRNDTAAIALFLRFDEALDEPALHQHDDGGRRQQREHRGGHDEVPFVARIAADDHPLDADHRRVH